MTTNLLEAPETFLNPALPEKSQPLGGLAVEGAELIGGFKVAEARLAAAQTEFDQFVQTQEREWHPDDIRAVEEVGREFDETETGKELLWRDGYDAALVAYADESGRLSAKQLDTLRGVEQRQYALAKAEADLEKHAPEKANDVLSHANALESEIDYHAIVRPVEEFNQRYENVGTIIGIQKLLQQGHTFTYAELQMFQKKIDELRVDFAKQGYLISAHDRAQMAAGVEVDRDDVTKLPQSPEELKKFHEGIEQAAYIALHYDPYGRESKVLDFNTQMMLGKYAANDTVESTGDVMWKGSKVRNELFSHVLEQTIRDRLGELPARQYNFDATSPEIQAIIAEAAALDLEKVVSEVEITGDLGLLPFELTESEIRDILITSLPPLAVAHTKSLEVKDFTPAESDLADERVTAGYNHDNNDGTSDIKLNAAYYRETYEHNIKEHPESGDRIKQILKTKAYETLVHEFAHTLHKAMPYALLKQWDDVTEHDDMNVDDYVKDKAEKTLFGKKREDFAASLALFATAPAKLFYISTPRFIAMGRIYKHLYPNYSDTLLHYQFRKIDQLGELISTGKITVEDLRKEWLSHEDDHEHQKEAAEATPESVE